MQQAEQLTIYDWLNPDSWSGRMYQEPSVPTKEKTSKPSSRKSSELQSRNLPLCLCLIGGANGLNQDASTMSWESGRLLGDYTMLSTGEFPKEENASLLSQILEDSAQPKYYLSARACRGILNRASKRGKELPEILKTALENQIQRSDSEN